MEELGAQRFGRPTKRRAGARGQQMWLPAEQTQRRSAAACAACLAHNVARPAHAHCALASCPGCDYCRPGGLYRRLLDQHGVSRPCSVRLTRLPSRRAKQAEVSGLQPDSCPGAARREMELLRKLRKHLECPEIRRKYMELLASFSRPWRAAGVAPGVPAPETRELGPVRVRSRRARDPPHLQWACVPRCLSSKPARLRRSWSGPASTGRPFVLFRSKGPGRKPEDAGCLRAWRARRRRLHVFDFVADQEHPGAPACGRCWADTGWCPRGNSCVAKAGVLPDASKACTQRVEITLPAGSIHGTSIPRVTSGQSEACSESRSRTSEDTCATQRIEGVSNAFDTVAQPSTAELRDHSLNDYRAVHEVSVQEASARVPSASCMQAPLAVPSTERVKTSVTSSIIDVLESSGATNNPCQDLNGFQGGLLMSGSACRGEASSSESLTKSADSGEVVEECAKTDVPGCMITFMCDEDDMGHAGQFECVWCGKHFLSEDAAEAHAVRHAQDDDEDMKQEGVGFKSELAVNESSSADVETDSSGLGRNETQLPTFPPGALLNAPVSASLTLPATTTAPHGHPTAAPVPASSVVPVLTASSQPPSSAPVKATLPLHVSVDVVPPLLRPLAFPQLMPHGEAVVLAQVPVVAPGSTISAVTLPPAAPVAVMGNISMASPVRPIGSRLFVSAGSFNTPATIAVRGSPCKDRRVASVWSAGMLLPSGASTLTTSSATLFLRPVVSSRCPSAEPTVLSSAISSSTSTTLCTSSLTTGAARFQEISPPVTNMTFRPSTPSLRLRSHPNIIKPLIFTGVRQRALVSGKPTPAQSVTKPDRLFKLAARLTAPRILRRSSAQFQEQLTFACPKCTMRFVSEQLLRDHLLHTHSVVADRALAAGCFTAHASLPKLPSHLASQHDHCALRCVACDARPTTLQALVEHRTHCDQIVDTDRSTVPLAVPTDLRRPSEEVFHSLLPLERVVQLLSLMKDVAKQAA